jgi:hypothetical protein
MSDKYRSFVVPEEKQERWRDALADVNCWMNGFVQGGGNYSPETIHVLRDIHDTIRMAYPTTAPEEKVPPILLYTPPAGANIDYAMKEAIKLAKVASCNVTVSFNGKKFTVHRANKLADVMRAFAFDTETKYPQGKA